MTRRTLSTVGFLYKLLLRTLSTSFIVKNSSRLEYEVVLGSSVLMNFELTHPSDLVPLFVSVPNDELTIEQARALLHASTDEESLLEAWKTANSSPRFAKSYDSYDTGLYSQLLVSTDF